MHPAINPLPGQLITEDVDAKEVYSQPTSSLPIETDVSVTVRPRQHRQHGSHSPEHLTIILKDQSHHRVFRRDLLFNDTEAHERSKCYYEHTVMRRQAFRMFRRWWRSKQDKKLVVLCRPCTCQRIWRRFSDVVGIKQNVTKEWLADLEDIALLAHELGLEDLNEQIQFVVSQFEGHNLPPDWKESSSCYGRLSEWCLCCYLKF